MQSFHRHRSILIGKQICVIETLQKTVEGNVKREQVFDNIQQYSTPRYETRLWRHCPLKTSALLFLSLTTYWQTQGPTSLSLGFSRPWKNASAFVRLKKQTCKTRQPKCQAFIGSIPLTNSEQYAYFSYFEVRSDWGILPEVGDFAVVPKNEFVEDDVLHHGIEEKITQSNQTAEQGTKEQA